MDRILKQERSRLMSRIRGKNTGPEMAVRRLLHRLGLRYRLHDPRLPGRPDLSFPSRRLAVFVHGCFWHRHEGCRKASVPEDPDGHWARKFAANVERDARKVAELRAVGWTSVVVWECELAGRARFLARMSELFSVPAVRAEGLDDAALRRIMRGVRPKRRPARGRAPLGTGAGPVGSDSLGHPGTGRS